jgi:hypothetical protein
METVARRTCSFLDLENREKRTNDIVHVVNIDVIDNPEDATLGAFMFCELGQKVGPTMTRQSTIFSVNSKRKPNELFFMRCHSTDESSFEFCLCLIIERRVVKRKQSNDVIVNSNVLGQLRREKVIMCLSSLEERAGVLSSVFYIIIIRTYSFDIYIYIYI